MSSRKIIMISLIFSNWIQIDVFKIVEDYLLSFFFALLNFKLRAHSLGRPIRKERDCSAANTKDLKQLTPYTPKERPANAQGDFLCSVFAVFVWPQQIKLFLEILVHAHRDSRCAWTKMGLNATKTAASSVFKKTCRTLSVPDFCRDYFR